MRSTVGLSCVPTAAIVLILSFGTGSRPAEAQQGDQAEDQSSASQVDVQVDEDNGGGVVSARFEQQDSQEGGTCMVWQPCHPDYGRNFGAGEGDGGALGDAESEPDPCPVPIQLTEETRDPGRVGQVIVADNGTGCQTVITVVMAAPPSDGWGESLAVSIYAAIQWPDASLGLSQFNGSEIYAGFEYSLVVESGFEQLVARDCAIFVDYPHCVEIVATPHQVEWDVGDMNATQEFGPQKIVCDNPGDSLVGDPDFKGGTGWDGYGGPDCMNIWWGMSRDYGDVSLAADIGWGMSLLLDWDGGGFEPRWGEHVESFGAGPFRAVSFTSLNSSGTGSGD